LKSNYHCILSKMNKRPYKILVIEDDLNLSYLLGENLRSLGYNLQICHTGSDGMKLIEINEFDLYILDLMLPDVNGFELAKRISKLYPQKPFLFLTAVKTEKEKFKGYEIGAEDYITKPFTFKELDYKIQVILRRTESLSNDKDRIERADLIFNKKERTAVIGDTNFKLTKRESDLLDMFMTYRNEYIDRAHILNALWERDDMYTARSMDVYIVRLRKIISHSKFLVIENLYGAGHRLIEKE
jgi:DNA-binding response OmpR family regulator